MNDILEDIKEKALLNRIPIMQDAGIEELKKIIFDCKPKRILEIGTAVGYSGSIMLLSSMSELDTVEIDEDRYNEAKTNFTRLNISSRVKQYLGDARDIIKYLDKKYDLILLDGPKGHYNEMLYYLDKIIGINGIIFADNVLFKGKIIGNDYPAHKHRTIVRELREFISRLESNESYTTTLLNTGDGILIARKIKM